MTKQSSHPSRSSLWIAMLATLAFAGAGQALAPTPAAALHIDACAQPEFGLCDAADEGPTSGDSSSGDSKGGGGSSRQPSAPPAPSDAPWDQRGSNSAPRGSNHGPTLPVWSKDPKDRAIRFRRVCRKISDHVLDYEEWINQDTNWFNQKVSATDLDQKGERLDPKAGEIDWVERILYARQVMQKHLRLLDRQWDDYNCTELGFSDLGL